jgi:hypothetical protein
MFVSARLTSPYLPVIQHVNILHDYAALPLAMVKPDAPSLIAKCRVTVRKSDDLRSNMRLLMSKATNLLTQTAQESILFLWAILVPRRNA